MYYQTAQACRLASTMNTMRERKANQALDLVEKGAPFDDERRRKEVVIAGVADATLAVAPTHGLANVWRVRFSNGRDLVCGRSVPKFCGFRPVRG